MAKRPATHPLDAPAEADAAPVETAPETAPPPEAETAPADPGAVISVRSISKLGRRRAGRAFGPEPVEIALADLSPRALDAILNDPALTVTGLPED